MKPYKKSEILLLLLCTLTLIIFYLPSCSKKPEDNEIKIGAILPLTGDGAKYGEAAQKGIMLALDEINKEGGIKGTKLRMIYEDSQGDPKIGVLAAQKLISIEKVPLIIGDLFSSVTLAMAPIMNQSKVVLLSPASSSPKITNAGDYIFRNCASDIFEGSIMGNFAVNKLHIENLAIIYINNDYGVGIKDVFTKTFTTDGGKILLEESFEQGATDFRSQLSKVKAIDTEAIYIVGYKELGQLLKQAKEIGIRARFFSTVMFEDPEILKVADDAAEGVIYSARKYDSESKEGTTSKFVSEYKQKYNEIPDIFAALSYDAMKIVSLAMQHENFTSEGIKIALYGIKNYPGVVGETSFDENGDVIQPAVIKTVKDGKFVFYK